MAHYNPIIYIFIQFLSQWHQDREGGKQSWEVQSDKNLIKSPYIPHAIKISIFVGVSFPGGEIFYHSCANDSLLSEQEERGKPD